ncbi:polysaccharide deacetylase family protein [Terrisporobacter sp.]|uniref:polysaccharide deacetylase family protein n=1 Tax=Terrisporobacter sp. TaxID=1965305 RepID=UPI00261C8B2E|nr:polysaccharide deacetylase family protein [Terrisporobacter sp.]
MSYTYKRIKAFILSVVLFLAALFMIIGFVFSIKNICELMQRYEAPINRVDTNERQVALTFDVAWGSENIEDILDILDKYNAKATFFLVGSWVDDNEDLVKEIHNRGHEIGNHSNTHSSFTEISKENKEDELLITSTKIKNLTGEDVDLFRPPFGNVDKETMDVCESLGYHTIKWDVDSGDWKNLGPVYIVDRVSKNTRSGSIILFHASSRDVSTYLDETLNNLQQKYSIVTVSELIYKDNYNVNDSGEQKLKERD